MLSSEKDGPCNTTGILALQEEGFGLAILESEDLAITTDIELALHIKLSAFQHLRDPILFLLLQLAHSFILRHVVLAQEGCSYLSRVDLLAGEGIVVGTHVDCCVCIRRLC